MGEKCVDKDTITALYTWRRKRWRRLQSELKKRAEKREGKNVKCKFKGKKIVWSQLRWFSLLLFILLVLLFLILRCPFLWVKPVGVIAFHSALSGSCTNLWTAVRVKGG